MIKIRNLHVIKKHYNNHDILIIKNRSITFNSDILYQKMNEDEIFFNHNAHFTLNLRN